MGLDDITHSPTKSLRKGRRVVEGDDTVDRMSEAEKRLRHNAGVGISPNEFGWDLP